MFGFGGMSSLTVSGLLVQRWIDGAGLELYFFVLGWLNVWVPNVALQDERCEENTMKNDRRHKGGGTRLARTQKPEEACVLLAPRCHLCTAAILHNSCAESAIPQAMPALPTGIIAVEPQSFRQRQSC